MAVEIKDNIYWIGVNDRTTDLFEGLWPVAKEGVTYNSYLIKDKKNVIIDLSKAIKTDSFLDEISQVLPFEDIDYVVINHMEPDHTGVLKTLKKISPKITILCTEKAKKMLGDYYGVTDNIRTVEDGESIDIGSKKLTFYHIPFVHWPETMATFDSSTGTLFSCDAFGSYGVFNGAIFDDECGDIGFYKKEALRYYVNIVAKFSRPVLNAIEKLAPLNIRIIAPSHGLIWRKDFSGIVSLYKEWALLGSSPAPAGISLLYGSMYGNTEKMMNAVAAGARSAGIDVEIFDVARTDASYIMPSVWTKSGVIIGAPTYEADLFPAMTGVLEHLVQKRISNKKVFYFGSYGWSKGALRRAKMMTEPVKWEFTDEFEFIGAPSDKDLRLGFEKGKAFAEMLMKENG